MIGRTNSGATINQSNETSQEDGYAIPPMYWEQIARGVFFAVITPAPIEDADIVQGTQSTIDGLEVTLTQ